MILRSDWSLLYIITHVTASFQMVAHGAYLRCTFAVVRMFIWPKYYRIHHRAVLYCTVFSQSHRTIEHKTNRLLPAKLAIKCFFTLPTFFCGDIADVGQTDMNFSMFNQNRHFRNTRIREFRTLLHLIQIQNISAMCTSPTRLYKREQFWPFVNHWLLWCDEIEDVKVSDIINTQSGAIA